jgi:hypothetical protein
VKKLKKSRPELDHSRHGDGESCRVVFILEKSRLPICRKYYVD